MRTMKWSDFEDAINILVLKIQQDRRKYEYVYGIPRGGLIPAIRLSHKLDLKWTGNPFSFDGKIPIERSKMLIVDDIADTGSTLADFHDNGYEIATLYWKQESMVKPRHYVFETDEWVKFPWEEDNTSKRDNDF